MNFTEFRASKAFKGTFDEVVSLSRDLEKSMGSGFNAAEFGKIAKKDSTVSARLRNALESFIADAAGRGLPANMAKAEFLNNFASELAANSRSGTTQMQAFMKELNGVVTPGEAKTTLAAAPRAERVAQPTGVIDGLIRNPEKLAKVGGPSVTTALRDYEAVLEGMVKRINRDGVKDLSQQERVALRAVGAAFEKDSKEAGRGITAAQARENLLDALDFKKGTKTRQEMSELLGKPAAEPKAKAPAAVRQEPALEPEPVPQKARAVTSEAPHIRSEEVTDAAKLESARNKLSSLFIDLTSSLGKENVAGFFQMFKRNSPHMANAPVGPVANPQTSGDVVKKMIEFFATDEGKALPAKLGKLSPQATLDALRDGFRVDNASLQGMAEKLSQGKPLSFSERIARSPKSTVAAIALTAYSSLAGYDFFVKDTLGGMPLVQNLPPTVLMEWSDKATVGKSGEVLPGMDDYKPQVDWEILKATNNTSYRNLLIAGALSTMDPKLQQETRNMLSADILKDLPKPLASGSKDKEGFDPAQMNENQRIAGTAFIQRLTSGLKIVATEQQQNIAILESQAASVEAQKRAATAQAGLNNPEAIGQRMTFGQPESAAPAYDEYQVDGESFNNRVKGVTANNPGLYDDLAKAFKDATKMDVKPEEELTATNKLTKGEAALFAEQARDILAKRKVDTEKAEQIVQLLIEPSISSPALSR